MKIDHILSSEEFTRVFAEGVKIKGRISAAYILRTPEVKGTAVGVVVSKKCAPRSVRRNYLKRLIYGYFTEKPEDLSPGCIMMVVRITSAVGDMSRKQVSGALKMDLDLFYERAGD